MRKSKILVVDDSAFMRRVITDIISRQPDMEVVGTARNGEEALTRIKELLPDVVTLDVEMPVMDGLQSLEKIMRENPLPVIMLSSLTQSGADATMKALQLGAIDFIPKPSGPISLDINKVAQDIVDKIRIAASTRGQLRRMTAVSNPQTAPIMIPAIARGTMDRLVLIGTSTGGPKALHEVIPRLPHNLPAAVLVVQHMPAGFTRSLAERLNTISEIAVKEAEDNDLIRPSQVYIAPGDYHMKIRRSGEKASPRLSIRLTKDPPVGGLRPTVDVMMESVANEFWSSMVGVIMTGMGQDGTRGAKIIKQKGGRVIAEDKSTCIVYGMPKSVIESGHADKVVPLPLIAQEIVRAL